MSHADRVSSRPFEPGYPSRARAGRPFLATARWHRQHAELLLAGCYEPSTADYCLTEILHVVLTRTIRLLVVDITELARADSPDCRQSLHRLAERLSDQHVNLIVRHPPAVDTAASMPPYSALRHHWQGFPGGEGGGRKGGFPHSPRYMYRTGRDQCVSSSAGPEARWFSGTGSRERSSGRDRSPHGICNGATQPDR